MRSLDNDLANWLNERDSDRPLMSLVGPPGVGKSWLLGRLHQTEAEQGRFVALLKATDLCDDKKHEDIKLNLVRSANAACGPLNYPTVLLPALPVIIEDLARRLSARCPDQRPLILVDGCDDLASKKEFDDVQREYLLRFFTHGYFRMIVVRRLGLTEPSLRPLSKMQDVGTFDQEEAESQRNQLNQQYNWPPLPKTCSYQWNYPYINCYLLSAHVAGQPITVETLTTCCRSLIERAGLGRDHLAELKHIAKKLSDHWTSPQYKAITGKDHDGTYVRHGLVSVSPPTYTIVDGLRELLQALPD